MKDWISVNDRLPYEDDMYLTYGIYGRTVRQYNVYHGCWDDEQGDDFYSIPIGGCITHWMPIPEPPK